jgi:hypothetical protein
MDSFLSVSHGQIQNDLAGEQDNRPIVVRRRGGDAVFRRKVAR